MDNVMSQPEREVYADLCWDAYKVANCDSKGDSYDVLQLNATPLDIYFQIATYYFQLEYLTVAQASTLVSCLIKEKFPRRSITVKFDKKRLAKDNVTYVLQHVAELLNRSVAPDNYSLALSLWLIISKLRTSDFQSNDLRFYESLCEIIDPDLRFLHEVRVQTPAIAKKQRMLAHKVPPRRRELFILHPRIDEFFAMATFYTINKYLPWKSVSWLLNDEYMTKKWSCSPIYALCKLKHTSCFDADYAMHQDFIVRILFVHLTHFRGKLCDGLVAPPVKDLFTAIPVQFFAQLFLPLFYNLSYKINFDKVDPVKISALARNNPIIEAIMKYYFASMKNISDSIIYIFSHFYEKWMRAWNVELAALCSQFTPRHVVLNCFSPHYERAFSVLRNENLTPWLQELILRNFDVMRHILCANYGIFNYNQPAQVPQLTANFPTLYYNESIYVLNEMADHL